MSDAAPTTGVIHDIGYQRYTGARLGRGYVVRSLYSHGVRAAFGLGRSAKAKIFPWFAVGVVSIVAVVLTAVRAQIDQVVLTYEEFPDALATRLAELGLPVSRDGRLLLVPLEADETYDRILRAVADLDLSLHRLDQRRHRVAELFQTQTVTAPAVSVAQEAGRGAAD